MGLVSPVRRHRLSVDRDRPGRKQGWHDKPYGARRAPVPDRDASRDRPGDPGSPADGLARLVPSRFTWRPSGASSSPMPWALVIDLARLRARRAVAWAQWHLPDGSGARIPDSLCVIVPRFWSGIRSSARKSSAAISLLGQLQKSPNKYSDVTMPTRGDGARARDGRRGVRAPACAGRTSTRISFRDGVCMEIHRRALRAGRRRLFEAVLGDLCGLPTPLAPAISPPDALRKSYGRRQRRERLTARDGFGHERVAGVVW